MTAPPVSAPVSAPPVSALSAAAVYDAALCRAGAGSGAGAALVLRGEDGVERTVDVRDWFDAERPGDTSLLARCTGATLDVGCGPGRLTRRLLGRGRPALGIDVSPTAVALARRCGATALRRDVFGPVPGCGRWRHLLLADGNIGIGGSPERLLDRCRTLLAPAGLAHVELAAPGSGSWAGEARIRPSANGPSANGFSANGFSAPFHWAAVSVDDIAAPAAAAAMRIVAVWTEAGRWFASLTRC